MMRRPNGAVLIVLALVLIPGAGRAADFTDVVARMKGSVVGVGSYQELRRPPAKLFGTGFAAIDGSYVITNEHVVGSELDAAQDETWCIFVGSGQSARMIPVKKVAEDADNDIAILKFEGAKLAPVKFGDTRKVVDGQRIAFTGYPIGAVLGLYPVTHQGIVSARTPMAIPQQTPQSLTPDMIKRLRTNYDVFQLDATAYPGNSGSPMYDQATGEVYGIISSVFVKRTKEKVLSDPSGITYVVPIDRVEELLQRVGLMRK